MQFATWEPLYLALLEDFGFSLPRDEEAAKLLAELLHGLENWLPEARCPGSRPRVWLYLAMPQLWIASWMVCGEKDAAFLAADGATAVLLRQGIVPDIIVTDLDGPFPDILKANQEGTIVVVHAHGDNLDALQRYVPQLKRVIRHSPVPPACRASITSEDSRMEIDAYFWQKSWGRPP